MKKCNSNNYSRILIECQNLIYEKLWIRNREFYILLVIYKNIRRLFMKQFYDYVSTIINYY